MKKHVDTSPDFKGEIEEEIGITPSEAQLLGAMIIEDEEQALFAVGDEATAQNGLQDDHERDAFEDGSDDDETGADPTDGDEAYASDDQLVKLPDGTETSVHELIRGNLRDADYRKKTMALADERKGVEEVKHQLMEGATQTAHERAFMAELLQQLMPQMPDPELAEVNPQAYQQGVAAFVQAQDQFKVLAHNHQLARNQSEVEMAAELEQKLASEFEAMMKHNPDFKDKATFEAFQKDAVNHFQSYGFSPEEIESVADHRFIKVMRDALAYRQLKDATPQAKQKLKGRPPVMGTKARKGKAAHAGKAMRNRISKASQVGDAQSVSDILGSLLEGS